MHGLGSQRTQLCGTIEHRASSSSHCRPSAAVPSRLPQAAQPSMWCHNALQPGTARIIQRRASGARLSAAGAEPSTLRCCVLVQPAFAQLAGRCLRSVTIHAQTEHAASTSPAHAQQTSQSDESSASSSAEQDFNGSSSPVAPNGSHGVMNGSNAAAVVDNTSAAQPAGASDAAAERRLIAADVSPASHSGDQLPQSAAMAHMADGAEAQDPSTSDLPLSTASNAERSATPAATGLSDSEVCLTVAMLRPPRRLNSVSALHAGKRAAFPLRTPGCLQSPLSSLCLSTSMPLPLAFRLRPPSMLACCLLMSAVHTSRRAAARTFLRANGCGGSVSAAPTGASGHGTWASRTPKVRNCCRTRELTSTQGSTLLPSLPWFCR